MLEELAKNKVVEELCKNIGVNSNYIDDLVQEVYLIMLEYDQEKLKEIYEKGDIKFWLTRVITNQYCSNTSPFYKKFRKYYDFVDDNNLEIGMELEDGGITEGYE